MYVCIVMAYYETGDLENILKQQRAKEQPLPEQASDGLPWLAVTCCRSLRSGSGRWWRHLHLCTGRRLYIAI